MNLPTLRQLQYLVAVVELRHFGQAAERCFVTQSTLSTGIQELEHTLGVQLLERTKRKVIPTQLGKTLAQRAQHILGLTTELVEVSREGQHLLSGKLYLGVIPTIGPFLLPRVLPGIRERFPQLELMLVEDQSARLLDRLHAGELDTAIMAMPYDIGNLQHLGFKGENFCVAFPKEHSLSQGGPVTAAELPGNELLLLEEGHCLRDHALAACHLDGIRGSAAFQGTSLYTLIQMVVGGQGITFLPEMAVDTELMRQAELSFRPLAETGPHRQLSLIWRPSWHRKQELYMLAEAMEVLLDGDIQDQTESLL